MTSDLRRARSPGVGPTLAGHDRGLGHRGGREALLSRPAPPGIRALDAGRRQVDRAALSGAARRASSVGLWPASAAARTGFAGNPPAMSGFAGDHSPGQSRLGSRAASRADRPAILRSIGPSSPRDLLDLGRRFRALRRFRARETDRLLEADTTIEPSRGRTIRAGAGGTVATAGCEASTFD